MKQLRKRTILVIVIPWLFFMITLLSVMTLNVAVNYPASFSDFVANNGMTYFILMFVCLIAMIIVFVYLIKLLPVVNNKRIWIFRSLNDLEEDERGDILSLKAIRFSSNITEVCLVLLVILFGINKINFSNIALVFIITIVITISQLSFLLYLEKNYNK